MKSGNFLKPGLTVLLSVVSLTAIAFAGSLTPPASPASTFYTLEEIYNSIAGTFDSSSISSSTTGSLIQGIKYINSNLVWASGSNNIWNLNSGNVGIGTTAPESKLHILGTTPAITLRNTFLVSQTWQIRNGATSAGSTKFDIYDKTASASRLVIQDDGNVMIGSASNPSNNSRVFIFGGTNGANVDVRGQGSVSDQATIELEGSDYDVSPNSALLQYYGPNGTGTTMGFNNQRLGVLRFVSSNTALIATDNSTPLIFGTNDTERMRLSGAGFLGIGTTAPSTMLEVQGTSSASYGLFGALQVAGFSSTSYSRFGTATATDATLNAANDLLISGSLEVDSVFRVDGTGSHSLAGEWIFDTNTLVIDSGTDFVGIGTTAPAAKLSVIRSGAGAIPTLHEDTLALIANQTNLSGSDSRLAIISENASLAGINFGSFATERRGYIDYDNGNNLLQIGISDNPIITIASAGGRVGIGTTAPVHELHVASDSDGVIFRLQDSDGTCDFNPEAGGLTPSCSSDVRLKQNIVDTGPILNRLMSIKIKDYDVRASGDRLTGIIAQELQQTWPELVSSGSNGFLMASQPSVWQIIKGLQEQQAQISEIASRSSPADESFLNSISSLFEKVFGIVFKSGLVQSIRGVFGIVETERLCVGNTCVTEKELIDLLQRANVPQAIPTIQPTPTPTPTETPIPYVDPTPTPSASPVVSPVDVLPAGSATPTPEPSITASPTPTSTPGTPTPEPTPTASETPTVTPVDVLPSP